MRPGTRSIVAFAVLGTITCLLPCSASAVSQAGAIVDVFSPSARGAALADAGGLVPEGPFALRWNAAGLALDQPASVGFTYNEVAKGLLCFTMLLGRLEVFTLLVLFTPMFWRI